MREALEVQAAKLFAEVATPPERSELQRLAARVDALSAQSDGDRFLYLTLHEKLHRRIAEGTHCQPLCEAIEKNQVLASTWLCVPRPSPADDPPRRHQELVEALVKGDAAAAARSDAPPHHQRLEKHAEPPGIPVSKCVKPMGPPLPEAKRRRPPRNLYDPVMYCLARSNPVGSEGW